MSKFFLNMTRFDLNKTGYVLKVTQLKYLNITVYTVKYYWIFPKYYCIFQKYGGICPKYYK